MTVEIVSERFDTGNTYYLLRSLRTDRTLLEFDIRSEGRRIEYELPTLGLHVPRPLLSPESKNYRVWQY